MFVDTKSMMMKAWHEHYALLATNCVNLESVHITIRVAKKNRVPIILNLHQGHLAYFPASVTAAMIKTLAESASVPVTLVLDHDRNPDCVRQAFRAGFSGLMIGASAFPLEENVRQTRTMMELATGTQFCMEGGLGHLTDVPRYDQIANADLMTQSANVEPFIAQMGIDLLTVSVGMAHGMYAPGVAPAIDSQRLAEISCCSSVSLALHGGSDTPFGQFQFCTTLEAAKINVGAVILERGESALPHTLCHDISIELVDALKTMELAFGEVIIPYLRASGSIGKA